MLSALNEAFATLSIPLVVDLSRVDFMDSTGLALLINAHRRVVRRGHGFAIVLPGRSDLPDLRDRGHGRDASACSRTGRPRCAPPPGRAALT